MLTGGRTSHVIESAITARLATAEELQACARAWCRRGRAGSGVIKALDHDLLDELRTVLSARRRTG